jgi:hypothetical protein
VRGGSEDGEIGIMYYHVALSGTSSSDAAERI